MSDPITTIRARLYGLVERGVVLLSDASTKLQALQLRIAGEATDDDLEHFEPYGITSRPRDPAATGDEAGAAEAITLALGGNVDNQVVVMVADRRFRLMGLEKGEVALYNFTGANVLLDEDGNLVVTPKAGEEVLLGGAGAAKEVVRKGDATLSDSSTDSAYWTWISGFVAQFAAWIPAPPDGGAALATPLKTWIAANPAPTKLDGKANAGSSVVKAVD